MKYALKVSDCNSFVKEYSIISQSQDRCLRVVYTDNPEMALTFDEIVDAALHLTFIWANSPSSDNTVTALCIAESHTSYKEI